MDHLQEFWRNPGWDSWREIWQLLGEWLPDGSSLWETIQAWLAFAFLDLPSAITTLTLFGLGVAVLLIIYTVGMRLVTESRERRDRIQRRAWIRTVSRYLAGDDKAADPIRGLESKQFRKLVGLLTEYLMDLEGEDRIRLTGLLSERDYITHLRKLLLSRREEDRLFSAHLLGVMRDGEAIPDLRQALEDRSELVRLAAASALMQAGDTDSVPDLMQRIGRHPRLRERLRYLLFEFGPRILPQLGDMLLQKTLEPWGMVTILDVMRTYAYSEKATEILYLATTTRHREVRLAAIKALSAFDDPTLEGFFEDCLEDPDPVVRAYAARAMGNIGNETVLPRMTSLLAEGDFWVVKTVAEALLELGEPGREVLAWARRSGLPPQSDALVEELLDASERTPVIGEIAAT